MDLFYDPDFSTDHPVLNSEESHHCIKVLRNTMGDTISITNGKGSIWTGEIIDFSGKQVSITVLEHKDSALPIHRAIAISPPKSGDRLEWFIEKATELGVKDIYFFISHRSERKKINLDRLRKKAISAVKQSHNPHLPYLHSIYKWVQLFEKISSYEIKRIAHTDGTNEEFNREFNSCITLIGPEGGFTDEEFKEALAKGFRPLSMGKNILRTETAGIIALIL